MLSAAPAKSGIGRALYFAALARGGPDAAEYYLDPRGSSATAGFWWGSACEHAGVRAGDAIQPDHFLNLFEGLHARTAERLNEHAHVNRRSGIDLTYSCPKSVSELWATGSPWVREQVQAALDSAASESLRMLEERAAFSRRGKGGRELVPVELVVGRFTHVSSRAGQPHLHQHCFVMAETLGPDGKWRALTNEELLKWKMTAGAAFRAHLAYELQTRLGVELERKKSWFEVSHVPQSLMDSDSSRRKEVLAEMDRRGLTGARAAAVATLDTRRPKQEDLPPEVFFALCAETGRQHGFGPEEARALIGRDRRVRDSATEFRHALGAAVQGLEARQSHWSERELLRRTFEEAQAGGGLWVRRVEDGVKQALADRRQFVALGKDSDGELRYTTPQTLAIEASILRKAEQSRIDHSHVVSAASVERAIGKLGVVTPEHAAQQADALRHITLRPGSMQNLSGFAGTGKSHVFAAARDVWEAEGFTVIGCAPTKIAANNLQHSSGIESQTIHSLLGAIRREQIVLTNRHVVVLDEAGMVPTKLFAELQSAVLRSGANAKLVASGDSRQLQPIEAGAPYRAVCKQLGHAEITEIIRQHDERDRKSVYDLAQGRAKEALRRYAEQGRIHVSPDTARALEELVRDYRADGLDESRKLILCATRAEIRAANEAVQRERVAAGELGADRVKLNGAAFHVNDRVILRKNSTAYGLANADRATVLGVNEVGRVLTIRLDDSGRVVSLPLSCYDAVELGYASTVHSAQAITKDRAYLLCSTCHGMTSRELGYTMSSRARGETHFYMDRETAGKKLENIARQLSRSQAKELAHDILARQEPGSGPAPPLRPVPQVDHGPQRGLDLHH